MRQYTRGLLSDLERKTAEPIALQAGVPPRNVQQFLKACRWDHEALTATVQRHVREATATMPRGALGNDERPTHQLILARNRTTGERKYFIARTERRTRLGRLLQIAFTRWHVEHTFRVAKSEIGLMHFEGRSYQSLTRHLALCLLALAFVALYTEQLREKKSGGDLGASVPGLETRVPTLTSPVVAAPLRPLASRTSCATTNNATPQPVNHTANDPDGSDGLLRCSARLTLRLMAKPHKEYSQRT